MGISGKVGCKYFIQLDDDYKNFRYRFNALGESCSVNIHSTINDLFQTCLNFRLCSTHIKTVALAQGGDMTSLTKKRYLRRKAMNSFFCDTSNPFNFFGRINEDVNTYVCQARKGEVFFTIMNAQLDQIQTQKNAGGLTEQYLDVGTYIKSFYTIMYSPSCAKIGLVGDPRSQKYRIHHQINWNKTAPKILREEWKRA